MRLTLTSVALIVLVLGPVKADDSDEEDDSGSSMVGRRHEYYYNTNRPCNFTTPAECLSSDNDTFAGGYRVECAWLVPTREIQYCWNNANGDNVCTEEGNQVSCGYCANVFARGNQYSDPSTVTCQSIRDQGITEPDLDGDRPVIYCKNDTVPEYVSEVCYNATKPIWQLTMCFEVECEREDQACDEHEAEYNCSMLVDAIIDSAEEYRQCNRYSWWTYHTDGNDTTEEAWDYNREECRESCPGYFEEGDDYYKCVDLWEYFAYYYCATNETWVERYSEACPLLRDSMYCDIANCTRRHCQRDCPDDYTDCYFTDVCYDELNEFRNQLGEYDELSPILAKYETKETYDDYCGDGCSDTFESVYNCAFEACLPQSCLKEGCNDVWDDCYNNEQCMDALNYTLNGVGYFVNEMITNDESEEMSTAEQMYTEVEMDSCCRICRDNNNEVSDTDSSDDNDEECTDDDFECDRCNNRFYGENGDELEDDSIGEYANFVLSNYMRWFFNRECEGDFCENSQMESLLSCISLSDGECADRSEHVNQCRGRCLNYIYNCFSDEDCGNDYSEYAQREQACMEYGSDNDDCNGWRNEPGMEDKGIMYWQYQCWSDGGCSQLYQHMWQCQMRCNLREDFQKNCAKDLSQCRRSDNDLESCMLDDCEDKIDTCLIDNHCYVNMTRFIRWTEYTNITAGYIDYMNNNDDEMNSDSFKNYVQQEYCEFIGDADCSDDFYSLLDCLYDYCINMNSYTASTPTPTEEYCFMDVCESEIDSCLEKGVCFNESDSFNSVDSGGSSGYGRRRLLYEYGSKTYDQVKKDLMYNLNKYDKNGEGTYEQRESMYRDAYYRGCLDQTGESCSDLFKNMIECVGNECIFRSPTTNDGNENHSSPLLLSVMHIIITNLIIVTLMITVLI